MVARRPSAGLLAACCAASGLVLLPLGVTVWNAANAGWDVASALLWRPLTGFLLFNTLRLIACAVISTGLIGTALAWLVGRI
jgi:iron(III) transport system permease protein